MNTWEIVAKGLAFCLTNSFNLVCFWVSQEAFEALPDVLIDKNNKTEYWELEVLQVGKDKWYDLTSIENNMSITLTKNVYLSLKDEVQKWSTSEKQ